MIRAVFWGVAAAPAFALIAWRFWMLALAPFGAHPLWSRGPLNVSEAAAVRDEGGIVYRSMRGEDLNVKRLVRRGVIMSVPLYVTPLEAAVIIRRESVVALLFEEGAVADPPTWTRLRCLAADVRASDVIRLLETKRPAGASAACPPPTEDWWKSLER
jgi:hypothetical protein